MQSADLTGSRAYARTVDVLPEEQVLTHRHRQKNKSLFFLQIFQYINHKGTPSREGVVPIINL